MMKSFIKNARLLRDDRSGAALILVSLALPMIFGMAAFAVDMGYMYYINSRLQSAADIAALAGGTKLAAGDKSAVETQALDILKLNLPSNWDVLDDKGNVIRGTGKSAVKITPNIKALCSAKLETAGLPCYAAPGKTDKINYLDVSVDAITPMYFASGLGFKNASLSSDAIVTADGSTMPPLNVAIVLDSTGSMTSETTTACGGVSMTKLACAKKGALGMLGTLWPVVDKVALYTYPGMSQGTGSTPNATTAAANAAKNICSSGTPTVADYIKDTNPANYKLVDFADDYRDMNAPPSPGVKTSANLVKALGGTSGCTGIQVGDTGSPSYQRIWTFYADAVDKAQADLVAVNAALAAAGQTTRQNVIVILSDGDANAPRTASGSRPAMIESARYANQCLQAITSAQAATAAGTWVYSVAYNAGTSVGDTCKLDTSTVSTPQVIVTTATRTVTYTQSYSNRNGRCGSLSSSTTNTSTNQTMAASLAPAPSVTGPTRNPSTTPVCSSSNRNISYTDTTVTVTVAATSPATSTQYDRTACDTMRAMASTPDKFYSIDRVGSSGGCVSAVNPTTTDLLAIFKKVALSLMTKRRAPKSAI